MSEGCSTFILNIITTSEAQRARMMVWLVKAQISCQSRGPQALASFVLYCWGCVEG